MPRAKDIPAKAEAAEVAPRPLEEGETLQSAPPPEGMAEGAPVVVSDLSASEIEGAAETGPAAPNPFGRPTVLVHAKEVGAKGIPVEQMQGKPLEAGYVEPMERSNPEYLAKLEEERKQKYAEFAMREKAKRAMGYGTQGTIVGASPNSPIKNVKFV